MNFTADLKRELLAKLRAETGDVAQKKAILSAFIRTRGELGFQSGTPTFFVVSETENVAEFFLQLFAEVFGVELTVSHATMDKMSGRDKLVFSCPLACSERVVTELGFLRKDKREFRESISSQFKREGVALAYIKGAFLGSGSCTVPSKNTKARYHLEFVFSSKKTADEFCGLLSNEFLSTKVVERKERFVVYMKSKEVISDFLAVVDAQNTLKKFLAIVDEREAENQRNRTENCASWNADKTAIASVKQVVAIEKIRDGVGFDELSEELKTLALLRLENPTLSLKELSDKTGIGKSCLNHRFRKLTEIANAIGAKEGKDK